MAHPPGTAVRCKRLQPHGSARYLYVLNMKFSATTVKQNSGGPLQVAATLQLHLMAKGASKITAGTFKRHPDKDSYSAVNQLCGGRRGSQSEFRHHAFAPDSC